MSNLKTKIDTVSETSLLVDSVKVFLAIAVAIYVVTIAVCDVVRTIWNFPIVQTQVFKATPYVLQLKTKLTLQAQEARLRLNRFNNRG